MSSDLRVVVDMLIGLALMEAIVKPVVVRLTKYAMRWVDSHIDWIPDWLYYPLRKKQ